MSCTTNSPDTAATGRYLQELQHAAETWRNEMEMHLEQESAYVKGVGEKVEQIYKEIEREKEEWRQEREREREEMRREREEWEREKEKMMQVKAQQSDIIELNVGGRMFTTTRATLCAQPDTLLAAMFSGRWDGSLKCVKPGGVVFLDFDPSLFEILVNHLRSLQVSPGKKLPSPSLSPEQKVVWDTMNEYLGFTDRLEPLCRFSKEYTHSDYVFSDDCKRVVRRSELSWVCAVGDGSVGRGEVCTWKLHIVKADCTRFGFINDGDVAFMSVSNATVTDKKAALFHRDGDFKPAGMTDAWDSRCQYARKLMDGDTVELQLDTRTDAPTVQVISHSTHKMPLPKEWLRFRLVVRGGIAGSGVEILSVN
eukprot:GDKI01037256.1.p1 GENE.GDKI01037256.1~~GDKI01037256.1.p1  ORF type:complete len:367 (+),score=73.60 GDKI01037256.1:161-1261(+)